MPNYAVYKDNEITNVIIADSKEIAEQVTGLKAIETDGSIWIGSILYNGSWTLPKPFPSWSWNGEDWVAPIPKPQDGEYIWSEEKQEWIKINFGGDA